MDTTDLQKFGKAIQEYFTDIFHTNDYFFLSVNTKIFTECIKRADVDEKKVISDLKDYYIYESPDKYVRLAIAAFQVKTFFELREEGKTDFLTALSSFYGTENIYNDCFNRTEISGKNNQQRIWTSLVRSFFDENKLNLFTDINEKYNEYTYLRYPYTQLFFLANNAYKIELLRVCKKLQINQNDDYKTIEDLLKNSPLVFCPLFLNSLLFPADSITPDKYFRILAFSIYVYASSKNFEKDFHNLLDNNKSDESIASPYEFEIFNDNGKWVLNIYKNTEFLQDSLDDDKAFEYLNTYVLPYGIKLRIFIQDSDGYKQVSDKDLDSDTFMPCVFISKKEIQGTYQNLIEKRFLGRSVFLYAFNSLEECLAILEEKDETQSDTEITLLSQLKGGIKTGRYTWLLGCEPVIPEGCNISKFDDKPAIYSIKKQNEFCRIQIIDNKPPINDYSFSKNNSGWKSFALPSVLGFDFDIEDSVKKEDIKANYRNKTFYNIKTFHNLTFSGFFDGINLVAEKAENAMGDFVKLEDNYLFYDDERDILKNKSIRPDRILEIGQEYEFKLSYKKDADFIVPFCIKESCINDTIVRPFKQIGNPKFPYRKYKQKHVQRNKKVTLEPVYFDFSINEIIANAIYCGAAYKEINFENIDLLMEKWNDSKIPEYLKSAEKNMNDDFFLVFRNITDTNEWIKKLTPLLKDLPKNVLIFFVPNNSTEQKYTITDLDFFHKQEQLKIWLRYIGFANWRELNNKCIGLITGENEEVKKQYENNPIYKLVYPMIINGDIEFVRKDDEFGFTLVSEKTDDKNPDDCQSMAMKLLNSFPDLLSYIKMWGEEEFSFTKTVYKKDDLSGEFLCINNLMSYLTNHKYLLFKERPIKSPHLPTYFGMFDEKRQRFLAYRLPDKLLDAASYCRCLIREHQKKTLFTYNYDTKELSCKNLIIIPILIQRILILFDKEQLNSKEIYMPYRNYKAFSNIPAEAVKCLKRIFGENAIEEK